jgi:hypothetical protein
MRLIDDPCMREPGAGRTDVDMPTRPAAMHIATTPLEHAARALLSRKRSCLARENAE